MYSNDLEKELIKIEKNNIRNAVKKFMLEYIEVKLENEEIDSCYISFDCDNLQKDLKLDDITERITSRVFDTIESCIDEIVNFKEVEKIIEMEY
ncbi:MAG: hypothetical protein E7172_05600 [Firmicutes bacterium]|nr:hypothetical protein [Bacillota bacterium]